MSRVGFLNVDEAELIMLLSEFSYEELQIIEKYNTKLKEMAGEKS